MLRKHPPGQRRAPEPDSRGGVAWLLREAATVTEAAAGCTSQAAGPRYPAAVPESSRTKEDLDQEWSELVEEHRLAMPGVQVLFGFLLILPFQNRFESLTANQEYVYFSALVCATIAVLLLITPTAAHRIRWRQQDKEALMRMATKTAIAATVFIASAMTGAVYLVTDVVFGSPATGFVTAPIAAAFILFWYAFPLWRRLRH